MATPSGLFFHRMFPLVVQHPFFLAAGAAAFLAADFLISLLTGALLAQDPLFQPLAEFPPRNKPV